jgi:pyruvate-formate lyase-activating enzyme
MPEELYGNIYDIQKFSVHDAARHKDRHISEGCPLRCLWCHSPESQCFGPDVAWMDIRCIGFKYCTLCRDACDRGAISESVPKKKPFERRGAYIPGDRQDQVRHVPEVRRGLSLEPPFTIRSAE